MNLDAVTAAYGEANCRAWLRVIRERESNQNDDAYTIINGGAHFDAPPWVHPYAGQSAPPGRAAGAYQYIPHTWERVQAALSLVDFSPVSQDLGAVYLTAGRGALDDVLRGDVAAACVKCRPEWTSLPGAAESSPNWTIEKVLEVFRRWGGTPAGEQPAAQIEEATPGAAPASPTETPMGAGLILGLVQTALQAFAPLAQQKIQKELIRHTDQATADAVAQQVMAAIQQATGNVGATPQAMIAATAAVTAKDASPAVVKSAQDDALARLGDMAPFIDKLAEYQRQEWTASEDSMDRAATRAGPNAWDMTRWLVWWALAAGSLILIALLGMAIIYALNRQALPEMLLTLVVQTVTGILGFVALLFAFRFGSSRSSAAKDEMVAQFASRRRTDR